MREISIEAAVVAMLLLEGCAPLASRAATVPVVDARRLANLYVLAEEDTACPSPDLSAWHLDDRVWQVSGCGDAREYAIFPRGFGARWQRIEPVGLRASDELGCPSHAISLRVEAHGVVNASGCGRAAVLQLQCEDDHCAWGAIARVEALGGAGSSRSATPAPPTVATLFLAGAPTAPAAPPSSPVIVVPDTRDPRPSIERALRSALDSERSLVLACGAAGAVIRGRWSSDRVVRFVLDPPWAATEPERCLQSTLPTYHVVSSPPGEVTHVVR